MAAGVVWLVAPTGLVGRDLAHFLAILLASVGLMLQDRLQRMPRTGSRPGAAVVALAGGAVLLTVGGFLLAWVLIPAVFALGPLLLAVGAWRLHRSRRVLRPIAGALLVAGTAFPIALSVGARPVEVIAFWGLSGLWISIGLAASVEAVRARQKLDG